jgi:hypothetical protein
MVWQQQQEANKYTSKQVNKMQISENYELAGVFHTFHNPYDEEQETQTKEAQKLAHLLQCATLKSCATSRSNSRRSSSRTFIFLCCPFFLHS